MGDATHDATVAAPGIALPVYIDEYDATGLWKAPGTPVRSIALPTAQCTLATGQFDDTTNGHYWYDAEGLPQPSVSGRIVAWPCYVVALGSKINDLATVIKTIAFIQADGTIDVTTTTPRPNGGKAGYLVSFHSVATVDGAVF